MSVGLEDLECLDQEFKIQNFKLLFVIRCFRIQGFWNYGYFQILTTGGFRKSQI